MWTRRQALAAALAAGACATGSGDDTPPDLRFANLETPSESVHSGVASEDGQERVTVRLCRYPRLGLAWVWVHARVGGLFYSFVDHLAPCGTEASPVGGDLVRYSDTAGSLVFERTGAAALPRATKAAGSCMARKSATSAFGGGQHRMEVEISTQPQRAYSGLNAGRTEVFGHGEAAVTIDGRRHAFAGPAQFHEQRQTNPRFTAPFCYMSLWGDDAASTMLIAPRRRDGYLLEGDRSTEVETMTIDPPAPRRALRVQLADGRRLEGEARVVQAYTIPLVGNTWRGHMVNVNLGGRTFRGHVNDYVIGDGVPYAG